MSTAEAEYNALSQAMQHVINSRQIIQELYGNRPDQPLSIPFFCDSESAIIMGRNQKDTKRTRHIQRRVHFVRDNIASRAFIANKIDGELNPSDTGTKNLNGENLSKHCKVMHTTVLPWQASLRRSVETEVITLIYVSGMIYLSYTYLYNFFAQWSQREIIISLSVLPPEAEFNMIGTTPPRFTSRGRLRFASSRTTQKYHACKIQRYFKDTYLTYIVVGSLRKHATEWYLFWDIMPTWIRNE